MYPRTLIMLVVGFAGGLTLAACSPAASCTTANCGGCCTAAGKCESGATADACGTNGASCGRCGTGTMCQAGECRAGNSGGGTGGGSGGGSGGGTTTGGGTGGGTTTGGGTGGGNAGNCRTIALLETGQSNLGLAEYRTFSNSPGHYNYAGWVYLTASSPDGFRVEVVYPNDQVPNFPYTETFSANTRYANCIACAIFYESCDPMTAVCARAFLGQSGSLTITRADRASAGRLAGSGMNVRFNQWDLATDMPDGTGCIIATTVGPFNIGWNADGGTIP
ncbi:MAG: hypothetical protein Q8N23_35270 [Archangium sp.]|nr:hypothetical protein [Archangium sp.]MDP3574887.1 hypothetical protein [Archangium sp.]